MKIKFILLTLALYLLSPLSALATGLLDIQEIALKNGQNAWLVEDHSLPVIAVNIAFKNAGSAQDPQNKQGLVRIMSNTMDEGAGPYNAQDFQKALNDNAISLYFQASRDDLFGTLKMLSADQKQGFKLLKLALTQPRFEPEAITRMVKANQARIQSNRADPQWQAARLLNATIYEGHPYAKNSGGTLSSLEKITQADLSSYHKKAIAQDNIEITVTGDITAQDLQKALNDLIDDLPKSARLNNIATAPLAHTGEITLYQNDAPQSAILIAQAAIAPNDPAYPAAQIMNYILGGAGFGSRLTKTIREEQGLTYGIYSYFAHKDQSNLLQVSTSTQSATVQDMLAGIAQQWDAMKTAPVTEEEVAAAKAYITGSLPLGLSSTDAIASYMMGQKLLNRTPAQVAQLTDQIKNVSIQVVQDLIKDTLDFNKAAIIIAGQPENIQPDNKVKILPDVQ